MRLAQPPGVRSCSEGGEWTLCRDARGVRWVFSEFTGLEQRLGEMEIRMVRAELRDKMKRATEGDLGYGPGPDGEVEHMAVTQDVLELRLSSRSGDIDEDGVEDTLHIRMFFSEPVELPGQMCTLMLYWKRPGEIDLEDQTDCARRASRRLDEWQRSGRPC